MREFSEHFGATFSQVFSFRQLKAHRFFLTEASPYFKTMLSVKSDSGKHVVASDMSFETLHLLIKHMYTGVLDEVTSVVQLKDLIKAAGCFNWDIRGYLALTINKIQTVSNSCEIANVELSFEVEAWNGWKHDELWDNTVYDFLCKNFNSIVAEETYLGLKPLCVNKIFSAPSIQIGSEMAVFKAIVLWVQHDFPGRHHHFPALLELVRYSKTVSKFDISDLEIKFLIEDVFFARRTSISS